jgi:predicted O-methyltransferase YrrM
MKDFKAIAKIPGMLTQNEGEYLFRLAQLNPRKGVIVEIGSWKGKSTICLALGSLSAGGEKVYAVDPHKPLAEEGYVDDTEAEFYKNIRGTGVENQVVPMVTTSAEAARGWNKPIRLLWIDGDHRYEQVRQDFMVWEPHVIEGGIVAMHDTIRKKGPKHVLWESIFHSSHYQEISIVDNITAAKKVKNISHWQGLTKWCTISCRALYIAARKLHIPYAKAVGRKLLRTLTT